jgi:DNA-binding NarL/FixJ family response regulator
MAQSDPLHPRRIRPKSTKSSTVLIADDDEFFRMALRTILANIMEDAEVIETSSLDEAVERLAETENASLALFDLAMPGMESAASLRAVRDCFPAVRVAVVSASKRRSDILLALEAGAHGYIPKSLGVAELATAIKAVQSGAIYVPASMADLSGTEDEPAPLLTRATAPRTSSAGSGPHLTPRQAQVLALVVEGLSNKEIARELKLGEGTVKVHMAALFRALGVTSRAGAAAAATRMLKPDPH